VKAKRIVGVLLAAGRSVRFGGDKLAVPLRAGEHAGVALGVVAFRNLRAGVDDVVVVVRPGDRALATAFAGEGARVVTAERADEGMGASLAAGVVAAGPADGYVIALADMPWIASATIRAVAAALRGGASIAVPRHEGRGGHPVGFAASHRRALAALSGDAGGRSIVEANASSVCALEVDDPAIHRDVDAPHDLR